MSVYAPRCVDAELALYLSSLRVIAIEGAKAVGKTTTALQHARTVYPLDDPGQLAVAAADLSRLAHGDRPILIDEWQRLPAVWDLARRQADDRRNPPGSIILAGSATPAPDASLHSGAGIVTMRMRPMSLFERGVTTPTVSLRALLRGTRERLTGDTAMGLETYADEILASGFPDIRGLPDQARRAQLDGYLTRIVDRDFVEEGHRVRRPATIRGWLAAYAAASSQTSSFEAIRDAATPGQREKPARGTTLAYRDVLQRLWILEPVEAWTTSSNQLRRLGASPKHQLVDPALAARLLNLDRATLLRGQETGPPVPRGGTLLGALFESLATLDVRVYAQAADADVSHLRTSRGDHEIDLIVRPRGTPGVLAIEVRLSGSVGDDDVRHLVWLRDRIGDELIDAVVITNGSAAYRRNDGIGVVPLALLGP